MERIEQLRLADAVKITRGTHIRFQLYQCQRLEEYASHPTLSRTGNFNEKRRPSALLGIDIHNVRSIIVLQRMKHDTSQFLIHYLINRLDLSTKIGKNEEISSNIAFFSWNVLQIQKKTLNLHSLSKRK